MPNWDYLNEITGGDAEFCAELLGEFLSQTPELIARLEQAIEAGDAPQVRQVAHTLKGSARSIGADSFAQYAAQLENLGRSGELSEAPQAIQQLRAAWSQLQPYLQSAIEQSAA